MTTKERIFEAAVMLFAEKGFHGTSIRDIAGKVGIKESSIYNHYPGKDAVLKAVLDYQMQGFRNAAGALENSRGEFIDITDPVEFWLTGARVFFEHQMPLAEPVSRIIINEMFLNRDCRKFVLDSLFSARTNLTENIFRAMHDMGMVRKFDFRKMAVQYVSMLHGLEIENSLRMLEGQSREESIRIVIEQISLFIEGLKEYI